MNTENKLPVLRPEDKPAIPEPADIAAPAGEKASRWKRPETHEEKMLFWMRVTGICAILLAVLAGAAAVMLLLNLSQLGEILSHLNSASVELEEASRQLSQALQSLNNEGLQELYAALVKGLEFGGHCVLEQYVKGREIQVGILAGKALPSIEIIPSDGFYDYENKYQPGAAKEVCPAEIPPEWEKAVGKAAETVYEALGLTVYSRADFIVTEDGTPWFLEINTLPGMTPTSLVPQEAAAIGLDYAGLCQRIIDESLKARNG